MKNIVIFGAGGHAHVVADIVRAEGNKVLAFLDDDSSKKDRGGSLRDYEKYQDCEFVIGIGDSKIRERLSKLSLAWHTAIHPKATISDSAVIGKGTVVMPNAVINADAIVGNHCIINTGAIIEHNDKIGDFSHISVGANLGGTVMVGKRCFIGIGATAKNNIELCDDVIIGAGAVVVNNISVPGLYYGVPAKNSGGFKK